MDLTNFTLDDWYTVLEGASAASGIVALSDLSGPIGLAKEAMASMAALREGTGRGPFITALRDQMMGADQEQQQALMNIARERATASQGEKPTQEEALQAALNTIRSAVRFVEDKAGAEAAAEYRQFVWEGAQKSAEASKEGGFLGIGGTRVSDAETSALDQIKAALDL